MIIQRAVYAINVSITHAFPPESQGKPASTKNIQIQYDVWQDRPTFRQSQRQYESVLRTI